MFLFSFEIYDYVIKNDVPLLSLYKDVVDHSDVLLNDFRLSKDKRYLSYDSLYYHVFDKIAHDLEIKRMKLLKVKEENISDDATLYWLIELLIECMNYELVSGRLNALPE